MSANRATALLCLAWLGCDLSAAGAGFPEAWQHQQRVDVPGPGLVKMNLPLETLDAARPGLEDLRLYDEAGNELPYVLEQPRPTRRLISQPPRSFQAALTPKATVLTLETGVALPLDGVTLETPAAGFLKPVRVEACANTNQWQTLAQWQPIFRERSGVSQLRLDLHGDVWRFVRLTVDDRRSPPIPFTGARLSGGAAAEPAPTEWLPAAIAERQENPEETRLTVNLGAANLDLTALRLETTEPLFTRRVTLAVPEIAEDSIRERVVAQGAVYRVALEGQPTSEDLSVPLDCRVHSRELLVLIKNLDNPPLPIAGVKIQRRPVYLVFLARAAGAHYLLTGNPHCAAPRYDLAALGASLRPAAVSPLKPGPLENNSSYQLPDPLAGIQDTAAALDVSAWRFRKAVRLESPGVQELELDLEAIAGAQQGFDDLRLLRGGKQLPYIIERTSISRALAPQVKAVSDPNAPRISRWVITLPRPDLPFSRLDCRAGMALFRREMVLYEETTDDRGEKSQRRLGAVTWVQTPDRKSKEFAVALDNPPRTDTLVLETDNGDNPPLTLDQFQLFYPATRVLFKAGSGDGLALFYGNGEAAAPQYDLSLVAGQLLAAQKSKASLGPEERLGKAPWSQPQPSGQVSVLLWAVLGLVVVVLLFVIARLLPKPAETESGTHPPKQ